MNIKDRHTERATLTIGRLRRHNEDAYRPYQTQPLCMHVRETKECCVNFYRGRLQGAITKFFQPSNHAHEFVFLTLRDESMSGTAPRLRCISVSEYYQSFPKFPGPLHMLTHEFDFCALRIEVCMQESTLHDSRLRLSLSSFPSVAYSLAITKFFRSS